MAGRPFFRFWDRRYSILPRRGRGTAAGGGGVLSTSRYDDVANDGVEIGQNFARGDAKRLHASRLDPRVSHAISFRPIATRMRLAIDLDCQAAFGAEEVENVRAGWVLAAEAKA